MLRSCSVLCALLALSASSCKTPEGSTPAQKRSHVQQTRDSTLRELYALRPLTRSLVENAVGYAVFSNISAKIFLVGTGNGYGIAVDNSTGEETYMRMAQAAVGFGAGIRSFRAVFVFTDRSVMRNFVDNGLELGGSASAEAALEDTGAGVGATMTLDGMYIYQLTDAGLALEASIGGTKYWQDDNLN